jgi:hypothetical protein
MSPRVMGKHMAVDFRLPFNVETEIPPAMCWPRIA